MALHIVGFKLCSMLLLAIGVIDTGLDRTMTAEIGGNVILLVLYTTFGLFFPIGFMLLFRKLKKIMEMKIGLTGHAFLAKWFGRMEKKR